MKNRICLFFVVVVATFCTISPARADEQYMPVSFYSKPTGFNEYEISAASIAALMGKPVKIMKVKSSNGTYYVKYTRVNDGTVWISKCKLKGQNVYWGTLEGRWRVLPEDSKVSFKESGGELIITEQYSDGSSTSTKFVKSEFK